MKVLIAVDSSPASQRVLEEAAARPWPKETAFCIASAIDVTQFAELPVLVEDAKREGAQILKAGAEVLARASHIATAEVLLGSPAPTQFARARACTTVIGVSTRTASRSPEIRIDEIGGHGRCFSPGANRS